MKKYFLTIFIFLSAVTTYADEFDGLKCGVDIQKNLVGKKSSNARVVVIEQRHRDLNLKSLGGDGEGESTFLSNWSICGHEYVQLIQAKNQIIRSVLPLPEHDRKQPLTMGPCTVEGKENFDLIGILKNNTSSAKALEAKKIWKIDRKNFKFSEISAIGVTCASDGIVSSDRDQ